MTVEKLDAIEARARAATPFETDEYKDEPGYRAIDYRDIARLYGGQRDQAIGHVALYVHHSEPANIALVAYAREDILTLCEELRKVRKG